MYAKTKYCNTVINFLDLFIFDVLNYILFHSNVLCTFYVPISISTSEINYYYIIIT